jgi:hypothetical protein
MQTQNFSQRMQYIMLNSALLVEQLQLCRLLTTTHVDIGVISLGIRIISGFGIRLLASFFSDYLCTLAWLTKQMRGFGERYQSSVSCKDTKVFADEVTYSTCLYLIIDF